MWHIPVSDLSALAGLSGLEKLDLTGVKVSDVGALSGMSQLKALWLSSVPVSDLTPLTGLENLAALDLSFMRISDLSPLRGHLPFLKELSLSGTYVRALSPPLRDTDQEDLPLGAQEILAAGTTEEPAFGRRGLVGRQVRMRRGDKCK